MSMSFWDMVRGKMNPQVDAKALNIALAPGGFVNEVQSTIVRGQSASYSADTQAL
jgi:hypothetical protein